MLSSIDRDKTLKSKPPGALPYPDFGAGPSSSSAPSAPQTSQRTPRAERRRRSRSSNRRNRPSHAATGTRAVLPVAERQLGVVMVGILRHRKKLVLMDSHGHFWALISAVVSALPAVASVAALAKRSPWLETTSSWSRSSLSSVARPNRPGMVSSGLALV